MWRTDGIASSRNVIQLCISFFRDPVPNQKRRLSKQETKNIKKLVTRSLYEHCSFVFGKKKRKVNPPSVYVTRQV